MGIYKPEIECATREEMKALQSQKLVKMVRNAYENVPFYKQKLDEAGVSLDDIKSIEDITKLPYTTKNDLRDTYPFGLLSPRKLGQLPQPQGRQPRRAHALLDPPPLGPRGERPRRLSSGSEEGRRSFRDVRARAGRD